jgi:hypothetical protein
VSDKGSTAIVAESGLLGWVVVLLVRGSFAGLAPCGIQLFPGWAVSLGLDANVVWVKNRVEMYEAAVVLVGAGLGVAAHSLDVKPWSRVVAWASLLIGLAASFLSGELAESWAFALIDVGQAWLGAIGAFLLVSALARGHASV